MSGPFEWRLQDIERKADEALRIKHEVATLRSDVDNLERANRELGSTVDGLRIELQALQEALESLRQKQEDEK